MDLAPKWETRRRLPAPGLLAVGHRLASSGQFCHLGTESGDGQSLIESADKTSLFLCVYVSISL